MIRSNVPNFLYIYKTHFLSEKNSQKSKIIGFFKKNKKNYMFFAFKHTNSDFTLV